MNFAYLVSQDTREIDSLLHNNSGDVAGYGEVAADGEVAAYGEVEANGEVEARHLQDLDRVFEKEVDLNMPQVALKCTARGCRINGDMFHKCAHDGCPNKVHSHHMLSRYMHEACIG